MTARRTHDTGSGEAGRTAKGTLVLAIDMMARMDAETSSEAVGQVYFDALRPLGLRALFARAYPAKDIALPGGGPAAPHHVYARISPPGWEEAYARDRLERLNPVVMGVRQRLTGFAWTDVDPTRSAETGWPGWRTLEDFKIENGLAVPVHGFHGYCAAMSLGFEDLNMAPAERRAIELTSIALHDRLRKLAPMPDLHPVRLTIRERDCLAFVADGKSDWEIGAIMGIAQATAHAHVEAAKRKLGAKTRAQAVARLIRQGGL